MTLYASEAASLEQALDGERGWRDLDVPPMTMLTLAHNDLGAATTRPLTFIAQDRAGPCPPELPDDRRRSPHPPLRLRYP